MRQGCNDSPDLCSRSDLSCSAGSAHTHFCPLLWWTVSNIYCSVVVAKCTNEETASYTTAQSLWVQHINTFGTETQKIPTFGPWQVLMSVYLPNKLEIKQQ